MHRGKHRQRHHGFEGASGFFDITLITLAELDGEAPYRVLINDVLVGSATNPEVTVDYAPVRHTFEHVVILEEATIAVESLANTNGKIPEGDGTAFARCRWTTLELSNGDAGTAIESQSVRIKLIRTPVTIPLRCHFRLTRSRLLMKHLPRRQALKATVM